MKSWHYALIIKISKEEKYEKENIDWSFSGNAGINSMRHKPDTGGGSVSASETTTKPASEETTTSAPETEAEVEEQDGLRKQIMYTDKELNMSGETGPFKYTIEGVQVSKLTATDETMASILDIEKDKEVTVVAINASAENTTDETNNFYLGQATLTTNTKEQADPNLWISEHIEGEFLGNVIHSGSMVYILPNTNADDLTDLTLHISAPSDADWNTIGEEVQLEITLNK